MFASDHRGGCVCDWTRLLQVAHHTYPQKSSINTTLGWLQEMLGAYRTKTIGPQQEEHCATRHHLASTVIGSRSSFDASTAS
jgi:hypothetical protein